ncbi:MAG: sensor histidine kinase [Chloroflexota bacterium]
MNPITTYLVDNMITIYFFYGLAFYTLGLALWLASRRVSEFRFVRAIRPLALFGLIHGGHEWFEMFQRIAATLGGHTPGIFEEAVRLGTLITSFVMLTLFAILLLLPQEKSRRYAALAAAGLVGVWLVSLLLVYLSRPSPLLEMFGLADVLGRYLLGIPGALLAAGALMAQQRTFREHQMPQFGRDLVWCATALLLYGAVGQLFVRQTAIFPSTLINSALFLDWFGIPVQLFRAMMAAILAFFMLRALNAFELENLQRLEAANEAQLAAQAAMMRAEREASREILHQVVMAQEAERQRIARELHDATGQSLTAIALGLHGVNKILAERVPDLGSQIQVLEDYGTSALKELRKIIADLRPSQLDDLGLVPALEWYIQNFERHYGISITCEVLGQRTRLPADYETALFRIAQEALTNVAKHAQSREAHIRLRFLTRRVCLVVADDGRGFDPAPLQEGSSVGGGWGLRGIQERATLLGGTSRIVSEAGKGTRVQVCIPRTTIGNGHG